MIKRLLAAFFIVFLIAIPPSLAEDTVIEQITQAEIEELDIEVPDDLEPGYHEMVIEVVDENDVVGEKLIVFCKDYAGVIYWDGVCPEEVVEIVPVEELEQIESREDLPKYDAVAEPEKTVDTQVAVFAVLGAVAAGAGAMAGGSTSSRDTSSQSRRDDDQKRDSDKDEREAGEVASADVSRLDAVKRTLGRGDASMLWQRVYRPELETGLIAFTEKVSAVSPMGARILQDGSYLRAMLSGLAFVPSILGIAVGIATLFDTQLQAMPPSFTLVAISLALSTIDAMAGLWISAIVLTGTLLSGNVTSLDEAMTIFGVAAVLLTPGLVASAIRPFRREVENLETGWERITDYLLAVLLGGWTVEKFVGSLNGLAGVQLAITGYARELGLLASAFIFIRLVLEDIATYNFPERLTRQDANMRDPLKAQIVVSLLTKTFLFFLVSYQFLGFTQQLLIGTALFALPQAIKLYERLERDVNVITLHFLLPKGALKVVVMVFIGAFFAEWVQGLFTSPESFVLWSFVVLSIPGLVLSLLTIVSGVPNSDWKTTPVGTWVYRIGGIAVAGMIFAMYRGVDLYAWVFG